MMTRHLLLSFALLLLATSFSFGQDKRPSKIFLSKKYNQFDASNLSLDHRNFFASLSGEMGLTNSTDMRLTDETEGSNGYAHFKYRQYHNGYPVFGATYILHEKNGKVLRANGRIEPLIQQEAIPAFDERYALHLAKGKAKAKVYADEQPTPKLFYIDPAFPKYSESVRLAYQVDVETVEPFGKHRYFVDAVSGSVLCQFPLILEEGVPSTGETKYYGTQNIITDSIGPNEFVLHDPTRGNGISIYDYDDNAFTNDSRHWDLANDLQDEVALDAHYCSQEFYDLLLEKFDWEGIDGNGGEMIVHVHNNDASPVNAFWDGESTNYGDGNCEYGPLTTLEVVGHEWMHAVTSNSSNLIYSSESGAINESMSDMFGKALEWEIEPGNFSWVLGHSFLLSADAEPFRIMDDPNSKEMPAMYKGEFWDDLAGVHTNSSIGNLWFVMLVDGRTGTNEAGVDFDVLGIGMDKASQIAFLCNRSYLTESSGYNDFYQVSLQAAEELYGAGSVEMTAVAEAWKAVGVPNGGGGTVDFDLSISRGFSFDFACGFDVFHPVEVNVSNLGTTNYVPDMEAVITLQEFSGSLPFYSKIIDETIEPGQVLTIVIDDWFNVSEQFLTFDANLLITDDDFYNNSAFYYYQIAEFVSSDISVFGSYVQPSCFSNSIGVETVVNNVSCDTVPAGTELTYFIETINGTVLWSDDYVLTNPILPNLNLTRVLNIDQPNLLNEDLNLRVEFTADPNPINNQFGFFSGTSTPIEGDYFNDFNSFNPFDEEYFYVETTGFYDYDYQGETYFGCTGNWDDPEFFTQCPEPDQNFNSSGFFSGVNASMEACVDLSTAESIYLSFDLVQFRNEFAVADDYLYSSMLQVKWTGDEEGKEIIFGQTEGEIVHYDFPLPDFFNGEIEIKFYTELGEGGFDPSTAFDGDAVIMDNLHIRTNFTNTSEQENGKAIQVAPNPTNGYLAVNATETIKQVEIHNINGQILRREQIQNASFELNVNDLNDGFYLLRLQNEKGDWAVKKIVKY